MSDYRATARNDVVEWNEKNVAILRQHYQMRGPAEVAKMIPGATRNAVFGKARRLGLQVEREGRVLFHLSPEKIEERSAKISATHKAQAGERRAVKHKIAAMVGASKHQPAPPPRREPYSSLPIPPPKDCQWLLNDARPWLFCQGEIARGPYCAAHHRAAFLRADAPAAAE